MSALAALMHTRVKGSLYG